MQMILSCMRSVAFVRRRSIVTVTLLGLSLLGSGRAAHAADVTVQPAPGAGFVVTDNTGASQRFKVLETGPIYLGGLVGSPPIENQALCYDTTTGQVGACPAATSLAFCVPDATASPRFVNNGTTITDKKTCLMWEKKTGTVGSAVNCSTTTCSDPYDVNNTYQWCSGTFPNCSNASNPPDGGAFTDFLQRVNGQLCASSTCPGLGGHSDWRVPTLSELQTIVDVSAPGCGMGSPCINAAFGPTVPGLYWSSATGAGNPTDAWLVFFSIGGSNLDSKTNFIDVRAVRGGW